MGRVVVSFAQPVGDSQFERTAIRIYIRPAVKISKQGCDRGSVQSFNFSVPLRVGLLAMDEERWKLCHDSRRIVRDKARTSIQVIGIRDAVVLNRPIKTTKKE